MSATHTPGSLTPSMDGVDAFNDLANMYPAGTALIVTKIFAHPDSERQLSKATCGIEPGQTFQN